MKLDRKTYSALAIACGLLSVGGSAATAANITFLGSDTTTGANWRSTSVAKNPAFDPSGDHAYGNDGYFLPADRVGNDPTTIATSLPSYISSTGLNGAVPNYSSPSYVSYDNPTLGVGPTISDQQGAIWYFNSTDTTDPKYAMVNFTVGAQSRFILTIVLSQIRPSGTGGSSALAVQQVTTFGNNSILTSADVTNAQMPLQSSGHADYLFFDITAQAGDKIEISMNGVQNAGFAGIAFETVPEQAFNKSWVSGNDWTTAVWSPTGAPNGIGTNASFPAQGAPATINLDANQTVGHLQFNGANGWTLATGNASALTLQANAAGASVLSTPTGSHAISAPLVLGSGIVKTGAGTLTLSGPVSGSGNTSVIEGTLKSGSATTFTALGELALDGTATFDLNGFNAAFTDENGSSAGSTIINNGSSDATLNLGGTSGSFAGLIKDGPTNKLGVAITNDLNFADHFTNAGNTFSGGLTLLHNNAGGTRLAIRNPITFTGTPGALTSGTYGTGPIIIGLAPTDKAGIMITATTTKATTTTEVGYINADLIFDLIASVFSM